MSMFISPLSLLSTDAVCCTCVCRYFQNLSNIASGVQQSTAPSLDQLRQFHERAEAQQLSPEQVYALSQQLGIAKSIVGKVLAVGSMTNQEGVDIDRFLFLLLVMSCDSFPTVLMQLFTLFGHQLEAARFHLFISFLAPHMDPEVTSQFLMSLEQQLAERESVTYAEALELPAIKAKFEGSQGYA